jgi:hypothetical protein
MVDEMLDELIEAIESVNISLRRTKKALDLENSNHLNALSYQLDSYEKLIKLSLQCVGEEVLNHSQYAYQEETRNLTGENECQTSNS